MPERIRIARDLHDLAVEPLFAACLELHNIASSLGPTELAGQIDHAANDLDASIAQIRTAIFALDASGRMSRGPVRVLSTGRTNQQLSALSPREHEILALIGEGLSNREIADRLSLAEKTVKNYVTSMLSKLGLHSRTQAAVLYAQAEQLTDARPTSSFG